MKSTSPLSGGFLKKGSYQAFQGSDRPRQMIWIRCNAVNRSADAAVGFGYLNTILSDGNGFGISMHFGEFIAVTLHGRNMQDLFAKLLVHEVDWVQEFDPRKWDNPEDASACITGIEVQMRGHPVTRNLSTAQ